MPYLLVALLVTACTGNAAAPAVPTAQFVTTAVPGGGPEFNPPSSQPGGAYPGPAASGSAAYPGPTQTGPHSRDGRSQSALTSYKLALETATKEYDANAKLYAVVPSTIMIGNLGGIPVLSGWFYKFKIDGSPREFIVQVVDTIVTGTTQAEPIEPLKPIEQPIDVSQVAIDSDKTMTQFKEFAQKQGMKTEGVDYDLELVNLEGSSGPVWSVVDPATKKWVYSISAVTGAEVPNPHGAN
jgi:hypothetical protein